MLFKFYCDELELNNYNVILHIILKKFENLK